MGIFFPNKKKEKTSENDSNDAGSNTNSGNVQNAGSILNNVSNGSMGTVQNTKNGFNYNGLGFQNGFNAIGNMADTVRIVANTVYVEGTSAGNILDSASPQTNVPKETDETNSKGPTSNGGFDIFGMLTKVFGNLLNGIGKLFGSIFGFAEGGSQGTINSRGRISGPGTGTSDSILAWVSPGEWIVKAETVRKVGPRFMERLNKQRPDLKRRRGDAEGRRPARRRSLDRPFMTQPIKGGGYYKALPTGAPGMGTGLTPDKAAGIVEFDETLKWFWDNYRVSPVEILCNAQVVVNITQKIIENGGSPLFRFSPGNGCVTMTAGTVVGQYLNRFAMNGGQFITVKIHPNMPSGTLMFRKKTIPYPMSNVTNIAEVRYQRDYYQTEWPRRTRAYEYGVYAPFCFGVLTNIANRQRRKEMKNYVVYCKWHYERKHRRRQIRSRSSLHRDTR